MKITENIDVFTKNKTYDIKIEPLDNLISLEIAECFKKQYPKKVCVITSTRIKQIELELIFVGLKLR